MDPTDQKYSKLLKTTQTLIDGYGLWDLEAIMAPRAANCIQHSLPPSLNRPEMNNTQYREYYAGLMPYLKDFKVTTLDTAVDTKTNKVVLHARSTAESVLGPYDSQQMIILKMTEDGEKICEVKEYFDSAQIQSLFSELAKYIENGGKPIGEKS